MEWGDSVFYQGWSSESSSDIRGGISNVNGSLQVTIEGQRLVGDIVAGQRTEDLPAGLASNRLLVVSVMASSIDVAARVVIWTDFSHHTDVLVKTYNDTEWHKEIVNLSYFHLSGNVSMIELSVKQIYPSNATQWVSYDDLAFGDMDL